MFMTGNPFFAISVWIGLVFLVFLSGCSGTPKQDVMLALQATKNLNPDPDGNPHSVVVRVYTLKEEDRFNKATFQDLWKHDRDVLGSDLLDVKELTMLPDSEHPLELTIEQKKGEGFLGVVAFFLKYQGQSWRQLLPLKDAPMIPFQSHKLGIVLDHHSIDINQPK